MDENTRYSLRLIGRASIIVVSVALILAIIGYIKRDDYLKEKDLTPPPQEQGHRKSDT